MKLHVDLVSAEGQIYSGSATMVFVAAELGEVGIAPRHAPLLTRMRPGQVRIQQEGQEEQQFFVSGGVLEVQPHLVTVMADTAERAADIDEAAAEKAKQRAEENLAKADDKTDIARAQSELAEAAARLSIVKKLRSNR
ncbi:ATP synthase F1 subunit epsilon [Salinisphaera shabanensis T35B1]|jgi:F-type H+-transporting ATPase subunit epsilon|uniref:ATP synthase epsilon chain n=1 Tax=Salinisphaera shabanensis E1L3A TaxID=1033802 RepID=U2E4G5_9GAMM|nr:F0F1 ATP synthase subunit epsilon [Salinisphaera shabanensis]ERJ18741.1 ATP synthase epsilon chain protein [Salinisphaera shabanensis E1L3A]